MQKRLIFTIILTLLAILLISCQGEKAVTSITITGGLKTEYNLNEKPDFSSVTALISYNDGTSEQVDATKHRRLARAGRSQHDDDLAALDIDVDVTKHLGVAERLRKMLNAYHDVGLAHRRPLSANTRATQLL